MLQMASSVSDGLRLLSTLQDPNGSGVTFEDAVDLLTNARPFGCESLECIAAVTDRPKAGWCYWGSECRDLGLDVTKNRWLLKKMMLERLSLVCKFGREPELEMHQTEYWEKIELPRETSLSTVITVDDDIVSIGISDEENVDLETRDFLIKFAPELANRQGLAISHVNVGASPTFS